MESVAEAEVDTAKGRGGAANAPGYERERWWDASSIAVEVGLVKFRDSSNI